MTTQELIRRFARQGAFQQVAAAIKRHSNNTISLRGLAGSSRAIACAAAAQCRKAIHIIACSDYDAAAYYYHDLYELMGSSTGNVLFYPAGETKTNSPITTAAGNDKNASAHVQRTTALQALQAFSSNNEGKPNAAPSPITIVSYKEALTENVPPPAALTQNTIVIHKNEKLSTMFVRETLLEYGFQHTQYVYEPGQFAVRGSIIDIFSYADNKPYRLDFFGSQVESIRAFDINTQLSTTQADEATIISMPKDEETTAALTDYLQMENTLLWLIGEDNITLAANPLIIKEYLTSNNENANQPALGKDTNQHLERVAYSTWKGYQSALGNGSTQEQDGNVSNTANESNITQIDNTKKDKESMACSSNNITQTTEKADTIDTKKYRHARDDTASTIAPDAVVNFDCVEQPSFNKNFELLALHINTMQAQNYSQIICTENAAQAERLHNIIVKHNNSSSNTPATNTAEVFSRFLNQNNNNNSGYDACINADDDYNIDSSNVTDNISTYIDKSSNEEYVLKNLDSPQHSIDNANNTGIEYCLISLHEGFTCRSSRICLYTDHQLFHRYHKYTLHGSVSPSQRMSAQELTMLHAGDYIVHIDHGIGVFGGLIKQTTNGKTQEFIKLEYSDGDVLMVSVHGLHRIARYKGGDASPPKIYKLGSGAWQKLKQTAKTKVKELARELISLYAQRRSTKGYAFSPDTDMQAELEASFIYEDTPDQAKASAAVKADMEQSIPMDRLVCGDVGFGKTEIAIRAAFKCACDAKQVGVLVPTTILALQHYKTFCRRLKNTAVRVEYLSRFKTAAETKSILHDLAEGRIDMLIGTHKLLGKEVVFKDLGLLIIDEEQKFGVMAKERLRQMRANVDTLTLTATPIPRTLQFSLIGARDLSIIQTPPPNRQPVSTRVCEYDEDAIKQAIDAELARGGQVFFVHNRIQNIAAMEALVRRLCPQASVVTAHGQMEGNEMEQRVVAFIAGEYDVLVSTNIVENGIDIPNANTMIVNAAHHFGLSDLHQLRGRVGRSNVKAHCLLLTAPPDSITTDAAKRLRALEQFADLGSGFNIAMQDLDIRGAGNLLGSEQSGFIMDIGIETYQKILSEALSELKQESGKDERNTDDESAANAAFVADCVVDTDLELLLPDSYVSSVAEKIRLYREIDCLQSADDIARFGAELTDRFGRMPDEVRGLLGVVALRQQGMRMGLEKIVIKQNTMVVYFAGGEHSAYYQTALFGRILQNINKHSARMRLRDNNGRLSLVVQRVSSVEEAMQALRMME